MRLGFTLTDRMCKCKFCKKIIPRNKEHVHMEDVHVSPKYVSIRFHIQCWKEMVEQTGYVCQSYAEQ